MTDNQTNEQMIAERIIELMQANGMQPIDALKILQYTAGVIIRTQCDSEDTAKLAAQKCGQWLKQGVMGGVGQPSGDDGNIYGNWH